jgi:hypothetical protein
VSASSSNTVTANSLLTNNPLLNTAPGAVPLATYNDTPNGYAGAAYTDTIGFKYDAGQHSHLIFNTSGRAFPLALSYNVLAPEGSAFLHLSTIGNISSNYTVLDNALTNGQPLALVFVSRRDSPGVDPRHLGVFYTNNHWAIFNEDHSAMPAIQLFDVFVVQRHYGFLPIVRR